MKKNKLIGMSFSIFAACLLSIFAISEIRPATATAAPIDSATSLETTQLPLPASKPELVAVNRHQKQALDLLNADRAARGLAPLRLSLQLSRLAENYARDMIKRNYFSHTSPEGLSPFERMRRQNIPFTYAGENLAFNVSIPAAQQAFMNSPGHKANVLDAHYTQVGLGVVTSPNGSVYVVQEFSDG